MLLESIVVVGGSLAGLRAVEALRREGYEGRLVLVGEESHRPYDRPPLSKEVLRGARSPEQIALTRAERFDALELDLRLGRRATSLDLGERQIELDDGEHVIFDGLLIATGARPRALPGAPALDGVHTLRTLEDCLDIRAGLEKRPRVVVVGAGFIGAEVAASCRGLDLDVTMVEALPVPLANALPEKIGSVVAATHSDEGVDLHCGVGVEALEGSGRVERVRLSDGAVIEADMVVVGIGVTPGTEWLESSGLALDDGVLCDETCAASAPGVVAAGDVARWSNPRFGRSMRVEHWTHAVEQGEAAAARLLAGDSGAEPFAPVPFVWSDQYELKIQVAGRPEAGDEMRVVDGSLEDRRFVAIFGRHGRLVGALAFNRVRPLMAYRRLLREDASWDDALAHAAEAA